MKRKVVEVKDKLEKELKRNEDRKETWDNIKQKSKSAASCPLLLFSRKEFLPLFLPLDFQRKAKWEWPLEGSSWCLPSVSSFCFCTFILHFHSLMKFNDKMRETVSFPPSVSLTSSFTVTALSKMGDSKQKNKRPDLQTSDEWFLWVLKHDSNDRHEDKTISGYHYFGVIGKIIIIDII